jgi:hypothetical protein
MSVKTRKKLIEVALPLEAINVASAREKSIRHGHPSTLHLGWARRPRAAARAVIFAQMVDDPSSWPERFPTEEAQDDERQRLFRIIEELVKWESTTDEHVLEKARAEIRRSWRDTCEDNKITHAPPISSTPTSCPASMTRSPVVAPCRSRRRGWASRRGRAISIRQPCSSTRR